MKFVLILLLLIFFQKYCFAYEVTFQWDLIDKDVDSLRFYYLGNRYQTKIEHVGVDRGIPADQTLIL